MKRKLLALALFVAGQTVYQGDGFLEEDVCLDRGGRYEGDPRECVLASGEHQDMREWQRGVWYWFTLGTRGLGLGALTYVVVLRGARSRSRPSA